jgi:hypothetical protein
MKLFKRFWFDRETGEFNWAIIAVILLAAIFFYNVITANVRIPENDHIDENAYNHELMSSRNFEKSLLNE